MAAKNKKSPMGSSFYEWLDDELTDGEFQEHFDSYKGQLDLGNKLKSIAEEQGYSVRGLAEAMGTSPSQVQRMFSITATKCTLETLMKFSVITGVDLHQILKTKKKAS